jgi:hypothetical protein
MVCGIWYVQEQFFPLFKTKNDFLANLSWKKNK